MSVTTEIQPGIVLADRFRVRERLGAGGMATVFLAEDCVLCRDVAVKRLHTGGSESDARRFHREARIGASLIHPNLATVFDTLSGSDGVVIVMEYVRGRPLSELIAPGGMDPRRLLEILRPVASALDYAHGHGVVHRDVKPANILIGEDRRVKLVDLGTATAGHLPRITAEHQVTGTLAYIAPERLAGESVGEPAADVYSLAVVAFEALTGARPHRGETPAELLDQILHRPAPDAREAWPQAPPGVAAVLIQGMDRGPERRQASAGAFVRDLDAALTERAEPLPVPEFPPTEPMTTPVTRDRLARPALSSGDARPARRGGWLLPVLACISALVAGGIWLAVSGDGGGNETVAGKQAAPHRHPGGRSRGSEAATATTATSGSAATSVPSASASTSPAAGAQLNADGYSLIQQGSYAEAIPVLRKAVRSFPRGTTDINFAYALFNLGHALRMAGEPERAIPILEQRLQIPNQTQTVQAELDAARAAAGQ